MGVSLSHRPQSGCVELHKPGAVQGGREELMEQGLGRHCPLFKKHWSHKQGIRTINVTLCDIKA